MRYLSLILFISFCSPAMAAINRIVSLAPHATEIAFSAGLGNKLVGVSDRSDYPPEAANIEKVANYQGVKLERIIALKPDMIIAWPAGNPARELGKLKKMGFKIYESHTETLEDIATNIEALSQYADDPSVGQNNAQEFRARLEALRQRYSGQGKVRYFYQLSAKPIITLGQSSWPGEMFQFCGGENIFAGSASPYPQVGIEQIIVAQPEVIFTSQHAMADGQMWNQWSEQLPAIRQHHVWSLNSDWINRPTMRTLKAVEQVCDYFATVRKKVSWR